MFEDLAFSLSLGSDNHSGVHPRILAALAEANRGHAHAYGLDEVSNLADAEFKRVFGENARPEYVFTGTAANVLSLAPFLKSYESVFASEVSHLNVDECGAPEKFWGGKIVPLASKDGRISPSQCLDALSRRGDQHFSQPRAVSLTLPTELGVCYRPEELRAWRKFCSENKLILHVDGARLANAAAFLNVSIKTLMTDAAPDVVSFGGTKNGLLGAEAVIFRTAIGHDTFKFYRKQAQHLSSKTRFLAAQMFAYLKDDLWLDIARHTTGLAKDLSKKLAEFPEIQLEFPVESNALFVRLPKPWVKPLREKFFFYIWDVDTSLARWMISWDWSEERNHELIRHIAEVKTCFPIK